MTNKINEFMEKLNMKRFRGVYEVFDGQLTHYVYADTKEQSMYLVKGISAEIMLDNDELYVNGATRKIKDLIKGKQTPYIIGDRKSTRLNSSHVSISYAVFCLKKK